MARTTHRRGPLRRPGHRGPAGGLATPRWDGPPAWVHGDLYPTNLLVRQGRLAAVIDFGLIGVGDPACDMLPAWALLTAQSREVFRAEVGVDDHTWARGRGWALGLG